MEVRQSDIQEFRRCAYRYWLRTTAPIRSATIPLLIGSAVAEAERRDNLAKTLGHRCERVALIDAGVATYDQLLQENDVNASSIQRDQGRDDVAGATGEYVTRLSPRIIPVIAEERIHAAIADGIVLHGQPDVIAKTKTGGQVIRDTKVGRAWTQDDADGSEQLTAYDLLHEARYGEVAARQAIDNITKRRGQWIAQTIWTVRSERQRRAYIYVVQSVVRAIEAGVDTTAPPGAWWCSRKWCPYWSRCAVKPNS